MASIFEKKEKLVKKIEELENQIKEKENLIKLYDNENKELKAKLELLKGQKELLEMEKEKLEEKLKQKEEYKKLVKNLDKQVIIAFKPSEVYERITKLESPDIIDILAEKKKQELLENALVDETPFKKVAMWLAVILFLMVGIGFVGVSIWKSYNAKTCELFQKQNLELIKKYEALENKLKQLESGKNVNSQSNQNNENVKIKVEKQNTYQLPQINQTK